MKKISIPTFLIYTISYSTNPFFMCCC